ncbi:uncharacterized protein DUF397 [Saccharothrix carnea]|uniref:Uncharacterized protein DUF397 n=2 Tax=Saccharothrix carnea TaxID=1280637 RepID=A0A2P8IDS8_SACCR|nr:DUF397 domain-containing protein [Saccharothrix carnea]PSL56629.1 uncharacterized protein DUF397 [Saccharothrix carnea]
MWSTASALTDARWRRSSRSNAGGAQCVEMACLDTGMAVRDSKAPTGPALVFPARAFRAFMGEAVSGGFDQR